MIVSVVDRTDQLAACSRQDCGAENAGVATLAASAANKWMHAATTWVLKDERHEVAI